MKKLIDALLAAPGLRDYPGLFPRLRAGHPEYLGDPARAGDDSAARALTAAGREGPVSAAEAVARYTEAGEIDCLAEVAPDTVTVASADWERQTAAKLTRAEEQARVYDRERVPLPAGDGGTWRSRVDELRRRSDGDLAGYPGAVVKQVKKCQELMEAGLTEAKGHLQQRLDALTEDLTRRRSSLDEDAATRALDLLKRVAKHIAANDLFLAVQRLGEAVAVLASQASAPAGDLLRFALPTRVNPFPQGGFHFGLVVRAAEAGPETLDRRGLGRFLPNPEAAERAHDPKQFLYLHAARQTPDWNAYFPALRRWLGFGEDSSGQTRSRATPDTPNFEPKGKLAGRWLHLRAESWQGAPLYDDALGRPRILAVVRLAVADGDRGNDRAVARTVAQALLELSSHEAVTDDERRFRQDGLVVVLVPGDLLGKRPYEQFRREVRLDPKVWRVRVAYLDDLDLLRLLPAAPRDRFRGLLELALPRFPDATSVTYQNSDAFRPRMFYGRASELNDLENGTTVVFSGRLMGKSSLLRRLQSQCAPESGRRAVIVGCSAITVGRSWQVLTDIERELSALAHREGGAAGDAPAPPPRPRRAIRPPTSTAPRRGSGRRSTPRWPAWRGPGCVRCSCCSTRPTTSSTPS